MMIRLFFLVASIPLLSAWGEREPDWPYTGPTPDAPIAVPAARYEPIVSGTKSYRPVEPLPWGDINRRVAPGKSSSDAPEMHQGH